MKKLLSVTLILFSSLLSSAYASVIDVYQGGSFLGSINSYSGSLSAVENYDYSGATNHLTSGPAISSQVGHLFFYEGSDGLSFNTILSSGGASNGANYVYWDMTLSGSSTDASVLLADDSHELYETATNDTFAARWAYNNYYGDGGIIGEIGGNEWELLIDPLQYSGAAALTNLFAFDSTGNDIALSINTDESILFKASASVPEPSTFLLLAAGLLGLAIKQKTRS